MKKCLLLAAAVLFAAPCAHGVVKQSGTFTCQSGLSLPLNSFYMEVQPQGVTNVPSFVTVTTVVSQFQALLTDELSGRLDDSCEVAVSDKKDGSTPALKFLDVDLALVSVTGDKGSQYVTATFHFGKIEELATGNTTAAKGASTLTPEQMNKALTEFLARAPKPDAN